MKHITAIFIIFVLTLCFLVGCAENQAKVDENLNADVAEENLNSNQFEEKNMSIVVADKNLTNLQLTDVSTPVYDPYTLSMRRAEGLNTILPEIAPWENGKVAYLTFDDGPDDKNTPAALDVLKEANVKATFYVVGKSVKAHPDVLKRIFDEGHAIGNHSYDHDYNKLYPSVANYIKEMEQTDEVIYNIIGMRPLITRAPGGRMGNFTPEYLAAIKENGYVEHDWNVSSADTAPGNPTAKDFIENIEGQATTNSVIILMHSSGGHEETIKALPKIIQVLKDKGYSFGVVTPMTPQPW